MTKEVLILSCHGQIYPSTLVLPFLPVLPLNDCHAIAIKIILILLSPPETLFSDPWGVPGPTLATPGI